MTSAPYLENNPNGLENLPIEFKRNFTLMRYLDSKTQELICNIDKMAKDYTSNVKGYSVDKKNETLTSIQRQFDKVKDYSNDKIELAIQTFELVDVHIKKVDSDLARFETKIKKNDISATRIIGSKKRGRKTNKDKGIKKKSTSSEKETVSKITKKKQLKIGGAKKTTAAPSKTPSVNVNTNPTMPTNSVESVVAETNSINGALVGPGVARPSRVLDMPVDPNEPIYCLCNQVAYGEMIACDNPDCPIEWFHFACVKLIIKPEEKWFCPKCITKNKKNKTFLK